MNPRDHLVITLEVSLAVIMALVLAEVFRLRVIETFTVTMLIWVYVVVRIREPR
jgi:hypothetical protein